jgi:hypothetical protein
MAGDVGGDDRGEEKINITNPACAQCNETKRQAKRAKKEKTTQPQIGYTRFK